jgi:xanthine dehydrogenase accessory factor
MIGSRRHAVIVKGSLLQQGIPEELIESIYTPIGIDIDAETPEEIAVAIAGEIIRVKNHYRRNFAFSKDMMKAILTQEREPMILATIIKKAGSAPRAVGTKMLVKRDGSIIGTIGGGSAEGEIIAHAAEMLNTARTESEILQFNLISGPQDAGMVCGGIMDVLFETI